MADLARLVTVLEAQTAKYSADLDKATRKLDAFGRGAGVTLKRFDSAAKQAARGIKAFGASALVFQLVSAAVRGAESAIRNLAATDAQFAATMKKTTVAYQNLWVAGQQTAEAQERLNRALGNPQLLGAARRAADNLAAGYVGMKARIYEALAAAQELDRRLGTRIGVYDPGQFQKQDYEGLVASKRPGAIEAQRQKDAAGGPNKYMDLVRAAGEREAQELAQAAAKAGEAAQKANKEFSDGLRNAMEDAYAEIERGYDTEAQRHLDYFIEPVIKNLELLPEAAKDSFGEMSFYAADFARSIEGNIKHALLNVEGGFKGFAKSAIDSMRDVMAEVAALKIRLAVFGALDEKTGNLSGGLLSAGINSLFGFANGGSFNVGGSGGTDSQLVAFRATPRERVTVETPGQQKGRALVIHNSPVIHVNAAQLTQDQAARMVADSQRMMWDELDRRYGLA